jgi:hypothetical protein
MDVSGGGGEAVANDSAGVAPTDDGPTAAGTDPAAEPTGEAAAIAAAIAAAAAAAAPEVSKSRSRSISEMAMAVDPRPEEPMSKPLEKEDTPIYSDSTKYDLIAVVCHHGPGFSSGHYTCYAREGPSWELDRLEASMQVGGPDDDKEGEEEGEFDPPSPEDEEDGSCGQWNWCNDQTVQPATSSKVEASQAYILMYRRRGLHT